jgi:hypothetical protein
LPDRVRQLAREALAFADAGVVEPRPFLERLLADSVHMRTSDDDRDLGSCALDPQRDLGRARVLHRHAGDADEVGATVAHVRHDLVDRHALELAVQNLDLVAFGTQ